MNDTALVRPDGAQTLTLGGLTLTPPVSATKIRIALALWGDCGCGKTTLAATAPGVKLWLQFDTDGTLSLGKRDDVLVYDASGEPFNVIAKFDNDNPIGLDHFLRDHPEIETVVLDSVTAFTYVGLQHTVFTTKNSSMREPGKHGYGQRNGVMQRAVNAIMNITYRHGRHVIFILHEGAPNLDDDGKLIDVPMAVNKGVGNHLGIKLNEIWHMTDNGKTRVIAVRPCRNRKPMKTRMFDASATPEFTWRYNPKTGEGDTITSWFNAWREGDGAKLALPK